MYEEKLRVAPLSGTIKPVRVQFVRVYTCIYQWITFSLHFQSKLI